MAKKPPNIELVKGTLKSILETINGLEGLDQRHAVEQARELLYMLKNHVGVHSYFQTNDRLVLLDAVFASAGWDEQGLRWTSEEVGDPEDIFVVHFTNKKRDEWTLA